MSDLSPETVVDGYLSMSGIPRPGDPEYSEWAAFCRDVGDSLSSNLPENPALRFSGRMAVATDLWRQGFRRTA